jgi:hypothetical protein
MKDPHPYVRDTTAWTIGRVFEFQHDAGNTDVPELITRETLPQVAQVCLPCGVLLGDPCTPPASCDLAAHRYLLFAVMRWLALVSMQVGFRNRLSCCVLQRYRKLQCLRLGS